MIFLLARGEASPRPCRRTGGVKDL